MPQMNKLLAGDRRIISVFHVTERYRHLACARSSALVSALAYTTLSPDRLSSMITCEAAQ
jgi:hypothetical protein